MSDYVSYMNYLNPTINYGGLMIIEEIFYEIIASLVGKTLYDGIYILKNLYLSFLNNFLKNKYFLSVLLKL